MTLFLSAREAYRQQQNTTPTSEPTKTNSYNTGYQAVLDDPKQQSRGYENVIAFPTGINLLVSQFDLAEDLILETNFYNLPFMAFSFAIGSNYTSEIIPAGHNCTATYFDFDEEIPGNGVYLRAGQRTLHVEVGINPLQFFCRHEVSGLDFLPKSLQLYLETDNISFLNYFRIGQTTPEMQIILHQIVNCPFHGLIKEIYLQAKCLELMALKLEPDTAGERELIRSRILLTDDNLRNGFYAQDNFVNPTNIERIEVLKGPASVLYGQFEPGGVVNYITKQPLREPYYFAEFTAGSFSTYRPSIDISGPLNSDKTLLYRLNAAYDNSGSFIDFGNQEVLAIAPALSYKIGDATTLILEYEYLKLDSTYYDGLPPDPIVFQAPISRFLGEPGDRFSEETGELIKDKLSATFAAYDITKENVATTDPSNSDFSIAIGEVKSRGLEFDLSGQILPGWNAIASYFVNDAFVSVGDENNPVGDSLVNAPGAGGSLWTSYEIQSGGMRGLGFGGGVFYTGDREATLPNTFKIPSYVRADATIFYKRDNWRVGLNFKNLFNTQYYDSQGYYLLPGVPLTVLGTVSVEF